MRRFLLILGLVVALWGNNCKGRLFSYTNSLNPKDRTTINEFLSYLATGKCGINIIYEDDIAKAKANEKMPFVKIKDMTLRQILNLIVNGAGLFYTLQGDTLKISYYKTKTYKLDWIAVSRKGSNKVTTSSTSGAENKEGGGISTNEGSSVSSTYSSDIWAKIKKDIVTIMKNNSPNPLSNKVPDVVVDKTSGLITVTGTKKQLDAVDRYIKELVKRLTKEVLIDVKILSVQLSKSNSLGVNWSQFQIQNTGSTSLYGGIKYIAGSKSIFVTGSTFSTQGLLNFLAQYGTVSSISNPKVVTLNNQKAIVTVGDTIYYKYASKTSTDQNGNVQTEYTIGSKFVGVILDITPQIADDGTIILSVYPRISSFLDPQQATDTTLDRPPNTSDKTLSTVVRLKDGQTLVMGGLITRDDTFTVNGIPVLKEIPIINFFFSSKEKLSNKQELVFIITPHIIHLNEKKTLRDLGFGGF
jgi:general secretion pathway protein D